MSTANGTRITRAFVEAMKKEVRGDPGMEMADGESAPQTFRPALKTPTTLIPAPEAAARSFAGPQAAPSILTV